MEVKTKFVELNKGELPHKDYAVYPNVSIRCLKVLNNNLSVNVARTNVLDEGNAYRYIMDACFGISVTRDGVDYIIPCRFQDEHNTEEKFMGSINGFINHILYEVDQIKDKYIISEDIEIGDESPFCARIYKYKN